MPDTAVIRVRRGAIPAAPAYLIQPKPATVQWQ